MARPDILNMPRIANKLAKLQAVHTNQEELMDSWAAEGRARQIEETKHEKPRRKPRNARRGSQENRKAKARGPCSPSASGGGAVGPHAEAEQVDAEGKLHSGQEEEIEK